MAAFVSGYARPRLWPIMGARMEFRGEVGFVRALQVLVVVMGLLIVAGVVVIGVTIAKRSSGLREAEVEAPKPLPAFGEVQLALPSGARVVWATVEGERLVIHIQSAGEAARFEIVDLNNGNRLGTVRVGAEAPR